MGEGQLTEVERLERHARDLRRMLAELGRPSARAGYYERERIALAARLRKVERNIFLRKQERLI